LECVPNFSEGCDLNKIEKIVEPFCGKEGVKLLDYHNDEDHNRSVVTVVGEPEPLINAVVELIKIEARRYGVNVAGSEIIGLVPMEALIDSAVYYLGVEDFSMNQVLEYRIYE
jgi:glutamate formiminotransferase